MARMAPTMARFRFSVLGGVLLSALVLAFTACGGGEGESGSVSVDLEGAAAAPAGAEAEIVPPVVPQVSPGPVTEPSAEQDPRGAQAAGTRNALLLLDRWHRAPADQRVRLLAGSDAAAQALSEFAQIWTGGAAAYRARLDVAPVTVFGEEFEAYGRAFAESGLAGLRTALTRGTASRPVYLAWTDARVEVALKEQELDAAAGALGKLLPGMVGSGYDRVRVLELDRPVATLASQAGRYLPSEEYVVEPNDSYWEICRKYRKRGIDAYQGWIADFNDKRNYNLRAGEKLRIPTAKLHLVAWREARLAALLVDGAPLRLYEVSMGLPESPTPVGEYTVDECLTEPMWYPPQGGSIPFGHPDNPLGVRWIGFKEDPKYAFHGTNSESTIGGFESHGCIRMHNADVTELFELIGPGAKVTINP